MRIWQTEAALAERMGVPIEHVRGIVDGSAAVTPDTARLLAAALWTTPEFWMNLQTPPDDYDCIVCGNMGCVGRCQ